MAKKKAAPKKKEDQKALATDKAAGEKFEKKVDVDFWTTDMHEAEIGIYKQERYEAKNRAFNKELEIIGEIKEDGKLDGIIGVTSTSWKDVPEDQPAKKRLVMKWFNKDSVAHIGTIEEIVLLSLHASMAADDEIPVFKMIIPDYDFIVDVKKEHPRVPRVGEIYSCSFKGKDDTWYPVIFDELPVSVGPDWDVRIGEGKTVVAHIDGKLLNVGGKNVVSFLDHALYDDAAFYKIVILFSIMCKYRKDILEHVKQMRELFASGKLKIDILPEEERLFRNPRLIKI